VQLPAAELAPVYQACDRHLAQALSALKPDWAIGIGGFAEKRLRLVLEGGDIDSAVARSIRIGQILHPSPASPAANRGWAEAVDAQLQALGIEPASGGPR
jgi:single-strand selective monofunctional uracil DNA glycosylase